MINLIFYLLAMAAAFYASILYGSRAGIFFVVLGSLFAIFAYLYLAVQVFLLRVSFAAPIAMVEQGKQGELELRIRSRLPVPIPKLRLLINGRNRLNGRKSRMTVRAVCDAGRETAVYQQITAEHCGSCEFLLRRVRIYDLTGFFYLTKWCRGTAELCVMPPIYETAVCVGEASRHFMGEAEVYDDVKAGFDTSEIFDVRAFRNGDRIQNIHWKLSARMDEWMVRENSRPLGCPVVLLMGQPGRGRTADVLLSVIASISCALTGQKCAHYISWYSETGKDAARIRIGSEEDLYLFFLAYYEEKRGDGGHDIRERYREKYRMEQAVTRIYVNPELDIYINDIFLTKLHKKQPEQELGGVEFIV